MYGIKVHFREKSFWRRFDGTFTRGNAFIGQRPISATDLSRMFSYVRTFDEFLYLLKRLNGFFTVIHQVGDACFLAVDLAKSFPLFYGFKSTETFYLSDDPRWILRNLTDRRIDDLSTIEFLLAGYVTGNDTLFLNVKQMQAGEALRVQSRSGKLSASATRYYNYTYRNVLPGRLELLLSMYDDVLVAAFKRLIQLAAGRTIVVPLSGGLDSRLILLMLKRLSYNHVIAYSYGKPGNRESQIGKKAAAALGIPCEFVPYSNEAWRRWYNSEEMKTYCKMADNLSSTPYVQDWPAVWELQKQQLIPCDSIMTPGYLGTASLYYNPHQIWSRRWPIHGHEVLKYILDEYMILRDRSRLRSTLEAPLTNKAQRLLRTRASCTAEEAANIYEQWEFQEYFSKFIFNSVRAYEFWGYEWWLPMVDSDVLKFWKRVPLKYRLEKQLHRMYARNLEKKLTGSAIKQFEPNLRAFSVGIRLLKKTHLYKPARGFHGLARYYTHPLGWYGLIPKKDFISSYSGNVNTYLAGDTLRRISDEWKAPEFDKVLRSLT